MSVSHLSLYTYLSGHQDNNSVEENEHNLNQPTSMEQRGCDAAKKFKIKFSLFLGPGDHSRYQKIFQRGEVLRISWLQLLMAAIICALQITTMHLWNGLTSSSSLENSGTGVWTSFLTLVAAICCLQTCKEMTYLRLHCCLWCHVLAITGSLTLIILGFVDSELSKNKKVFSYKHDSQALDMTSLGVEMAMAVCIILMIFGSFLQLLLSLLVGFRVGFAISSRIYRIGFKAKQVKLMQNSIYNIPTNEQEEAPPPPYDSVVF